MVTFATNARTGPSLHAHFNELDDMGPAVAEKCGLIPRILETIFLILAAEKAQVPNFCTAFLRIVTIPQLFADLNILFFVNVVLEWC